MLWRCGLVRPEWAWQALHVAAAAAVPKNAPLPIERLLKVGVCAAGDSGVLNAAAGRFRCAASIP